MEENSKEPEKTYDKYLIGIIITVIPFWGYLLAYNYESGFAYIYNIPSSYDSN